MTYILTHLYQAKLLLLPTIALLSYFSLETIPEFHWFITENMSATQRDAKFLWYKERKRYKIFKLFQYKLWLISKFLPFRSRWHFKKEIADYCTDDAFIVCQLALKFSKEWVDIQDGMQEYFNVKLKRPFLPFNHRICTLGSFVFR